jgi:cobalt/nickel transport system permease protein
MTEIPRWLTTERRDESRTAGRQATPAPSSRPLPPRKGTARFLDRTLRHVVSFVEETLFNETTSAQRGLLQMLSPKLKVISLLSFVVALSLQKSIGGIALFSLVAILLAVASGIPLTVFAKRLMPAAALTAIIAAPALLNLVVGGESVLVLFRFERSLTIGPLVIPQEIAVTRQGMAGAVTLVLRVITSVSLVFLLAMTTPPNTFMKTFSSLAPGPLRPVVAVSYRYIFFLVRRVEHFIMGLRSRQIVAVESATGRRWAASRIGLLFSVSMELSNELALAMESRGYRGERFCLHTSRADAGQYPLVNKAWLVFSMFFVGVTVWKSFV